MVKTSTRQELNIFFGRINFYFPPISTISVFLKTTKMYIYKNVNVQFYLFPELELAKSHSLWIFEEFGE